MAAYAFTDNFENMVQVAELNKANSFTGVQTFTGSVESTSKTNGTVVITGGLGVQGDLFANRVWGAVWNDLADCVDVPDNTVLEPGYAYCFDGENYFKSTKYLEDGFIGIHSDTAGFYMGKRPSTQLHAGVAGFVLAHVDKEYPVGTPLTCGEGGILTKINDKDMPYNPHKIVATYWKNESAEKWGPVGQEISVNGRKWVKVV